MCRLNNQIADYVKRMFISLGENYHTTLLEWHHEAVHVHVLFKTHPKIELSAYKSESSRDLKKRLPRIGQKLWKEGF